MIPISDFIWNEKYRYDNEAIEDTYWRIANHIYSKDPKRDELVPIVYDALQMGDFIPSGRIHAGAGTDLALTLINCFHCQEIEDSIEGILDALKESIITLKYGGGIGVNFSPIRPKGARLVRAGSDASGPVSYMKMWDIGCETIKLAGKRRGAMLAGLSIDHPDVLDFITAKRTAGVLTNFNLSVLVSDAFITALRNNQDWDLGSFSRPYDSNKIVAVKEKDGACWYVYRRLPAVELWNTIITSTYNFSEPGIMFIDRINDRNNLAYCEKIIGLNPCGEQCLPEHGACDLGHVNLTNMIRNPFTNNSYFDMDRFTQVARLAVRFLDNVLDVSLFPNQTQWEEAQNKRRIGVGIMGLANALQMLGIDYASEAAIQWSDKIARTLRDTVYSASITLARERGPFPLFKRDDYLSRPFIQELPSEYQTLLWQFGIRNPVLMSIAPTGTVSLLNNNISSGIEPTYSWQANRKIRMDDGSFKTVDVEDYGYCKFRQLYPKVALPSYMVTALELPVEAHLRMVAIWQKYIDSSISKTINCPEDISFEDFKDVYDRAYDLGIKCVSTHRHSEVRGSILIAKSLVKNGRVCPNCKRQSMTNHDGCWSCDSCGASLCDS